MLLLIAVTLYPFLHVIFASISNSNLLMAHRGILIFPQGLSAAAYKAVLQNNMIYTGYTNTLIILVAGLTLSIILTCFAAYALSRRDLVIKKHLMMFIVFTMFFSGGLIPFYYTVSNLGLNNTLWALILPSAINTFNMIILRTNFENVPASLEESANLDGAGDLTVLFRIVIPISLPTIAVVTLYYAVAIWNSWFNAMIFIRDKDLYPLQLVLREILIGNETSAMQVTGDLGDMQATAETIKYAVMIVATLPILVVYPFLQKYFVKGALVGAVKE